MSVYQLECAYTSPTSQSFIPSEEFSSKARTEGGPDCTTGSINKGDIPLCYNSNSGNRCCEKGRSRVNDPVTGQPVCSCQYSKATRLAALSPYPRLTTTAGVIGIPYPSTDQNPYPSIDSTFYPTFRNHPCNIKDETREAEISTWTSAELQTISGYYHYHPAMTAAYGYDFMAGRKNATRESTATLKAWLNEHKKNPYPTKGEKIMLAVITRMTLTQVSTWFANARRRLKKDNKMTWEPKNKTDGDESAILSDCDDKDKDDTMQLKLNHNTKEIDREDDLDDNNDEDEHRLNELFLHHQPHIHHHMQLHPMTRHPEKYMQYSYVQDQLVKQYPQNSTNIDYVVPSSPSKTKIWSLADTAACKTPPPMHTLKLSTWCEPLTLATTNTKSTYINTVRNEFISPGSSGDNSNSTINSGYSSRYGFYTGGGTCFTDVQTDTPPQTPPNTNLLSVVPAANDYSILQQHPIFHYTGNNCKYDQSFYALHKNQSDPNLGIEKYSQQYHHQHSQSVLQFSNHQSTLLSSNLASAIIQNLNV